jgi:hypothetical protein
MYVRRFIYLFTFFLVVIALSLCIITQTTKTTDTTPPYAEVTALDGTCYAWYMSASRLTLTNQNGKIQTYGVKGFSLENDSTYRVITREGETLFFKL